jgi:uncharacterized membrane protein YcgQ (UPF0703/DUF1980 family)
VTVAAWLSPEHFSKQAFEQRGVVTDASGLGERKPLKPAPLPPAAPSKKTEAQTDGSPATPTATSPGVAKEQTSALAKTEMPPPATAPSAATATASTVATKEAEPGTEPLPEYLQKTAEGYVIVEVLDMLYAVQDSQLRKDFEGRTVQLIAQMMPSKGTGGPENRFKAVRMFMTCCAADARPVATLVETNALPELPEMTWVRIVGKATFPIENGKRTAIIQATSVTQTKPPEESMLF